MNFTELRERDAIRALVVRYARAIDRRDLAAVRECFAPDAAYEGSLGSGRLQHFLQRLEETWGRYARAQHLLGNQMVELDGDRARCETYAIAHQQLLEGVSWRLRTVGLVYEDDLSRGQDGWRITRRRVRRIFAMEEPLPEGLPDW